jgi:hypothetical protein
MAAAAGQRPPMARSMSSPRRLHDQCRRARWAAHVDVRDRIRASGWLVPGQADWGQAGNARQESTGAGLRWRLTLQRRWDRKLDEVVALAGACQGVSAAGDDLPGDGAALPSFRLYCRAAAAYEDLAVIADAIDRADAGTYGRCGRCKRPMADQVLADDPLRQYCAPCTLRQPTRSR